MVQRILDTVLWPSPVTAHWVACQQNLCQTWEWTFSAPWDKMVMKCPPHNHGQAYEQKGALPTEDWHSPSASTKIKSWPLQLLIFNAPERSSGWKSGMRHSVLWGKTGRTGLQIVRSFQEKILWVPILASSHTIQSQNRVAMVQISWEITRWCYGCTSRLDLVLLNTWVFWVVSGLDATILKTMSAGS